MELTGDKRAPDATARTPRMWFSRPLASLLCVMTAAAVLSATSVWGVTVRDDQSDQSYLDLGASPDYASVGTFSSGLTGCATLIAPDWVLTAAHLFIASSGTFTINGATYTTDLLIKHPNYVTKHELEGYDMGLAHLTTPVSGVTPATRYCGSLEPVSVMTFVGLGLTGTGLTGARRADFQKRAFQGMADGDFGNPAVLLGCDFDNPHSAADNHFGDPTPLLLEGCVADGDSGGGVFLTADSTTYLAGVISFVAAIDGLANADYGDVTGFGRVSAFNDWINIYVPEPSSLHLAGLGAAYLLLCGRRGWTRRTGAEPGCRPKSRSGKPGWWFGVPLAAGIMLSPIAGQAQPSSCTLSNLSFSFYFDELNGPMVAVCWDSCPGVSCEVWSSTNLVAGQWSFLTSVVSQGTRTCFQDRVTGPQKVYAIRCGLFAASGERTPAPSLPASGPPPSGAGALPSPLASGAPSHSTSSNTGIGGAIGSVSNKPFALPAVQPPDSQPRSVVVKW